MVKAFDSKGNLRKVWVKSDLNEKQKKVVDTFQYIGDSKFEVEVDGEVIIRIE
jgi:predicted metalloendopeptidase